MTRKKLEVIGWVLFACGVLLLSFTRLPGVIVMILACGCFVLSRVGKK